MTLPASDPDPPGGRRRILGVTLATEYPLRTPLPPSDDPPDITFTFREAGLPAPPAWKPAPDYASPNLLESGASFLALYKGEPDGGEPDGKDESDGRRTDLLRFSEVADFLVADDRIDCCLFDPDYAHMVEIHLLGTVLSYWLEREGIPVLHAAAVAVNGAALGFVATNKGGKSSLAASLMQIGHPLLSDDLVGIQRSGRGFEARPGYPSMRFWPDQAAHFHPEWERHPLAHPRFSKRRIPVGDGGFGSFLDAPRPLACLYLPERRKAGAGDPTVAIGTIPTPEAVIELIRGSFLPNLVEGAGLASLRLQHLAELAAAVPVRRVAYPEGMRFLPYVRDRILEDAAPEVSRVAPEKR